VNPDHVQGGEKYQSAFYVYEELASAPSTSAPLAIVGQVCLPANTFKTMLFAINSTSVGYFSRAAVRAASASGRRPRWVQWCMSADFGLSDVQGGEKYQSAFYVYEELASALNIQLSSQPTTRQR
jgi:hypothetical protein